MKEQLHALLLLQEIDTQINREEEKQKQLPAKIKEIQNIIAGIESRKNIGNENLKSIQLKIKRREIDAKAIDTKIEKHQNELYGGKTSDIKELKQLQKVIELLKADRDKVEEDLLIIMDQEDDLKVELQKIEQELSQAKNQLQKIEQDVNKQEKEISAFIEQKTQERKKIISSINKEDLINRYNMLWQEKEGLVLTEIEGSICSGCNLSLPSDIIYQLQKNSVLITCPNCNRILLWKENK
ncbi:MAG: C4-type zinc ribbon domain-containing protein [Atribacterota bacterium]|nr:C4-type zinc ribbon domain-containing protein [Atribacterota bacterium]